MKGQGGARPQSPRKSRQQISDPIFFPETRFGEILITLKKYVLRVQAQTIEKQILFELVYRIFIRNDKVVPALVKNI